MRIAILYICTGKYNQFFEKFYESSIKYFLCNHEKQYFVFTDDAKICTNLKNVQSIQKECREFPLDSLFRFEMFLEIEEKLLTFDYIFFFNANMNFLIPINDEILPKDSDGGLVSVIHPGFYNKPHFLYPFERNKKSKAYISPDLGEYNYFMGSLNGGKSIEYMNLIKQCAKNIREDYTKNIVAIFHDESHLNKHLSENKCLKLSPSYAFPEDWILPFKQIIILKDKVKIDFYFNKGRDNSFLGKLKKYWGFTYRAILWYI